VWFFYEGVLHALIVATYVTALSWAYSQVAPAAPLMNIAALPDALRIGIAIIVVDFCYYLQHRCNHAVPWFWQLHTVHHSQKQLNFFTDFRYHVLEYIVRETFLAVPFIVLGLSVPEIVYVSVFLKWYTRFYHANIKTDLWLLRYVLVTPQSHRIHHSIEERHQNKNFGSLFSIWDFMFGTQYRKWDEYPETGIHDSAFPHETQGDIASLLLTPLKQMVYPLRQIGRSALWNSLFSGAAGRS
jgi:sterol desaturase/sphingolipid hydroxylase (fatty acid hydroxylase superfamily)